MSKHRRAVTPKEDAQSFGFIGLFVGFIVVYFAAEVVLAAYPHPYHWITAGAGAVVIGGGAYGYTFCHRTRGRHRR